MSHSSLELTTNHPRLVVSALGLALSGVAASPLALAAEPAKDGALELDALTVKGDQAPAYKVSTSVSKKYTAPLRETPRTITVIPEQVIKDTGSLTLVDALRTTSGITFGAGEGGNPAGDRPVIRGFNAESDVFLDGLRDVGQQARDMFNLEQVEVSKGPASAYTGAGSTGGSLNLVSKAAKLGNFNDASVTLGTDQTRRYTLDSNYQFSDSVAGRINLLKHDANVAGRDSVNVSRWGVAPTITFGLGTDTRSTLSYFHLQSDDVPDYGIPLTSAAMAKADGGKRKPVSVDKDNFYGLKHRDFRKNTTDTGTFAIEHDLNDQVTVSNTLRLVRTTYDSIVTNPNDSKAGNIENGFVYRSPKSRHSNANGWINQTDVEARFNTGDLEHTVVGGIEASHEDVHNRPYSVVSTDTSDLIGKPSDGLCGSVGPNCADLNDPSHHQDWTGTITKGQNYTDTRTKTVSAYVFDTLKFNEQWSVNGGVRYNTFNTTSKGYGTLAGRGSSAGNFKRENNTHFWNYQLGLVYNPLPNGSIYAAWSTSSNPVGETSGEGGSEIAYDTTDLSPERNKNYELGTKWDFFDERLGINAAVFRTEKENARVTDEFGGTSNIGKTRVDGFELGVTGQPIARLNVFANYTYLRSRVVDGGSVNIGTRNAPNYVAGLNDGNRVPNTPENSFSFWTTYDLTNKLTVGGGANYMDSRFGDAANTIEVPSYWRYDAMVKYTLNKTVDFQLNVQNLTDKRYFDQVYPAHMVHVAPGRTALLSTNFHF